MTTGMVVIKEIRHQKINNMLMVCQLMHPILHYKTSILKQLYTASYYLPFMFRILWKGPSIFSCILLTKGYEIYIKITALAFISSFIHLLFYSYLNLRKNFLHFAKRLAETVSIYLNHYTVPVTCD